MGPTMEKRSHHAQVEPLFAALDEETPLQEEEEAPRPTGGGLKWKLLWAAIVLFGLIALVVKQSF